MVCEEEGNILFYNTSAQFALGQMELLGRPLPESWKEADAVVSVPGEEDGTTESVRIVWMDILWEGNVAWYGVAVPVVAGVVDPSVESTAQQLKVELEDSQELIARQVDDLKLELHQSREMAAAEADSLRARLERAEERAQQAEELRIELAGAQERLSESEQMKARLTELEDSTQEADRLREELDRQSRDTHENDELRASLAQSQIQLAEMEELRAQLEEQGDLARAVEDLQIRLSEAEGQSADLSELRTRLELAESEAAEASELRGRLEQSVELVAVETERRQVAESEREKLEAKLRDLHQRSLTKLEAARNALESERTERNELSERLSRLKTETDELREQLQAKALEAEEARSQSGEQFGRVREELIAKAESLSQRDHELALKNDEIEELSQKLAAQELEFQKKCRELMAAEERAALFRKEYEELDREMLASQEQSVMLTAKLQSVESRFERYQRLHDRQPNEFSRGGDAELELERLKSRVEELEVELAAASAASLSRSSEQPVPVADSRLQALEAECSALNQTLSERESRLRELESSLAAASVITEGEFSDDPQVLMRELAGSRRLLEELRFHRELEYQEAVSTVRGLQERLAGLSVNGIDPGAPVVTDQSAEVEHLKRQLDATLAELGAQRSLAGEVPSMSERIRLLEAELQDAFDKSTTATDVIEVDPALVRQVQQLQVELDRARSEASPEELNLARRRIAELEQQLSQAPASNAPSAELQLHNQRLESELGKTREQLHELNLELRRTLEGDRETKKLAYADQLTGLPNLNLTGQYLQVCFERSGRNEGALALILIDLDHFRRVNDALGQRAGDELLKQVGARLQRCVTEKDTAIARRGEDEFMVVAFLENARVDGEALLARVRGIAHNLLNELAKPFEVMDQKVQVTASLGVALYPGPAQNRTELLEQTEHAMYKAKETGRARVSFYTEEIHVQRERKKYLETELRQGLVHHQFGMLFQPIYDLSTSKAVGVEALLRWNHPTRGLIEPAEFLEVAEDTGLIVAIGDQVLPEALNVAKQKFMKRRFLTVNLSFRQLIDSGFSQRFMKHLQVAGVPPHEIIVEVSEKATRIDPERVKNTLAHLAHWGVGVGLDDFGTGSSELSSLIEMNLRVLKIDASVVARVPDDRTSSKLCQAVVQMAKAFDVAVLAEGVESPEQLKFMQQLGCQYAQGNILGEPMNVNALMQHL